MMGMPWRTNNSRADMAPHREQVRDDTGAVRIVDLSMQLCHGIELGRVRWSIRNPGMQPHRQVEDSTIA